MDRKKRIILGVTGSVATVKIFKLASEFEEKGCEVKLITTSAAWLFILSTLLRNPRAAPKLARYWETGIGEAVGAFSKRKGNVRHINLVKWADALVVAPASANTIGKIANAFADNFLTTIALAMPADKKIFVAPAMNVEMWNNPFFQENLEKLKKWPDRYKIIAPACGTLQCGDVGLGKMAEVKLIVKTVKETLG